MTKHYITYPTSDNYKWQGDPDVSLVGTGYSVPRGIEAILSYNGVVFNDTSVVDKYRVLSIDGLADPDIRDSREDVPGDDGEDAYDAYYGGRTIVLRVRIEAFQLDKLRDMEEALRTAFSVMEEKPLYFLTGDPEKDHYINCRKSASLSKEDNVQTFGQRHFREWQITLRASDPRFYRVKKKFLSRFVNRGPTEQNSSSGFGYSTYRKNLTDSVPTFAISLGETSGTTNLSSASHTINTSGSVTVGDYPLGIFGNESDGATTFDNINDSITTNYQWCSNTLDRTLSIWFRPEDIPLTSGAPASGTSASQASASSAVYTLFGSDNSSGGQIGINSSGQVFLQTHTSSASTRTFFGATADQNKWNHLAMIVNRSSATDNATLYLNGKLISTVNIPNYGNTTANLLIGARSAGGVPLDVFKGQLAYPAVHAAKLTENQLKSYFVNIQLFSDYSIVDENVQVFVNEDWPGMSSSGTTSLQAKFTNNQDNYLKVAKNFSSGFSIGETYSFSGEIKYTRVSEMGIEVYRPIDPATITNFTLRAAIVFYTEAMNVVAEKFIEYTLEANKTFKFNLSEKFPATASILGIEIDAVSLEDITTVSIDNLSLKTSETFPELGYIALNNVGNYNSYPVIYLTGPMTGAEIINSNASEPFSNIKFKSGITIPSSGFYKIDTKNKTITDHLDNNKISELDPASGWLRLPPGESRISFSSGTSLSSGASVQIAADWQDAWI